MKRLTPTAILAGTFIAAQIAQATPTVEFKTDPALFSCDNLSADGRYVCGSARGLNGFFPEGTFIWDTHTGAITLLNTAGQDAVAITDDGTTVVGDTFVEGTPGDPNSFAEEASYWSESAGFWQSIGFLPNALQCPSRSNAYDISADGSVIVGLSWDGCSGRAFRWSEATGMQELEALANGNNRATVVSADGNVIAGFAQGNFSRTPAIWDGITLEGTLLGPDGAEAQGEVLGMNSDASVFLGTLFTGSLDGSYDAVKWVNGQVETIGAGSFLPGWGGNAVGLADDGTVIGFDFLLGNRRAWIQPQGKGPLLDLADWATAHGAQIPDGWDLFVPRAISSDGQTIAGWGIEETGFFGFVLVITPGDTPCDGDANGDQSVDLADLNLVLANFGTSSSDGDVDGSGAVDLADLNLVLANFGTSCG